MKMLINNYYNQVFSIAVVLVSSAFCASYDNYFDPDDILRPDLMPSSLLMINGFDDSILNGSSARKTGQKVKHGKLSSNGSWFDAYTTMGFHRTMLNEYLCRNFVADEILSQMQKPYISHRLGKPEKDYPQPFSVKSKSRPEYSLVKENLLSDPGSSNYRDWLTKTTTLEDIYRHYEKDTADSRTGGGDDSDAEYDGGEITGYDMPAGGADMREFPQPMGSPYGFNHQGGMMMQEGQSDPEKTGAGGYDYTPHHVHFHGGGGGEEEKESYHGLALNDVFDIALTALAFLSFGMFILQVIMCITMNKTPTMMQMVEAGAGEAEAAEDVRFRRSTSEAGLNELARRTLRSIEAGLQAQDDHGACVRRLLCEDNSYSRGLQDVQKIWIPVWGLGMSWMSSRFIKDVPSSSSMLDALRACALGLARADCSSLYPGCDLRHLLGERRNRNSTASGYKMKGETGE